jgi:hypothetical protein
MIFNFLIIFTVQHYAVFKICCHWCSSGNTINNSVSPASFDPDGLLSSEWNGMEWSAKRTGRFTTREDRSTQWWLGGPPKRPDISEKKVLPLLGSEHLIVQPVTYRRYPDSQLSRSSIKKNEKYNRQKFTNVM